MLRANSRFLVGLELLAIDVLAPLIEVVGIFRKRMTDVNIFIGLIASFATNETTIWHFAWKGKKNTL